MLYKKSSKMCQAGYYCTSGGLCKELPGPGVAEGYSGNPGRPWGYTWYRKTSSYDPVCYPWGEYPSEGDDLLYENKRSELLVKNPGWACESGASIPSKSSNYFGVCVRPRTLRRIRERT